MKIMRSMLILTLAASTAGSVFANFTAVQKASALGKGLGLAGLGFVLFGKGLNAMNTVTENLVTPGIDTIRRSGAYQSTVGRLFRKPSAQSSLADLPKDLKKNIYILCGITGSLIATKYLALDQHLKPLLPVSTN